MATDQRTQSVKNEIQDIILISVYMYDISSVTFDKHILILLHHSLSLP